MKNKTGILDDFKLAGAYCAYLIGSGFASGQEIMQFYTGYGIKSIAAIAVSALLFIWVGITIMRIGFDNVNNLSFRPYSLICGNVLGRVYEIFAFVYLFCIVVVMISGAGASINEYFGINHYLGSIIIAILVYASIAFGLKRLLNTIGIIGPIVVCFTIIVSIITIFCCQGKIIDTENISQQADIHTPTKTWIGGGVLYAAYNLICAINFFSALGGQTGSRKQASKVAIMGGGMLSLTILFLNIAFLSRINDVANLEIPTLYLARNISPFVGGAFLIILLCGIFSTAAPMAWAVCDRIVPEGTSRRKQLIVTAIVVVMACMCGFLPFSKLVGIIYPISGYMGILFIVCLFVYWVKENLRYFRKE